LCRFSGISEKAQETDEDYDYQDWMRKNRTLFLAVLVRPLVGMVIAIALILWSSPPNAIRTVGIILVIIAQ